MLALCLGLPGIVSADCQWVEHSDTVCTDDEFSEPDCTTTFWWEYECTNTSGGGGTGGGDGGGGGGGSSTRDSNGDGVVDSWEQILSTADPCASNFDLNDRMGTNHGGPNTVRPGHKGVDIQADDGDPVYSMKSGSVLRAETDTLCGYFVTILHADGSKATYCHLRSGSATLAVGSAVSAGTWIALANNTGSSTGHHLHVSYWNPAGTREEYFWSTGTAPSSSQLDPGGC